MFFQFKIKKIIIMLPEILKIENRIPNQYEPIRNCRFRVEFSEDFKMEDWLVDSLTLPKFIKKSDGYFNHCKIFMSFINLIGPSSSQKFFHNFILDRKNSFGCKIFLLDPTGIDISLWELKIDSVDSVDFGKLDYNDHSINKIEIMLNVEEAILVY